METVEINGAVFTIRRIANANRTGSARLRGREIIVSIPSRWPPGEKERVAANLLKRAIRSIEKGRWRMEQGSRVSFADGQKVVAMGRPLDIVFIPSKRFSSRSANGTIEVRVVDGHPKRDEIASRLVRKRIEEEARPIVLERVRQINCQHFCTQVPRVSIRDNSSRWGSCSPDGSISLNFRLLFMPGDVLDYVIVHELAHTRYRSHGVRFWALVGKIVPDHKEKRRWLRENGWSVPGGRQARSEGNAERPGQRTLQDCAYEEQY